VILKPMRIIFGDRATFEVENEFIDVNTIAIGAAKEWIKENLRFVNGDSIHYQVEIARGSAELTDIFKRKNAILGAMTPRQLLDIPHDPHREHSA